MKKILWLIALVPLLTLAAPPVCVTGDTEITCAAADATSAFTDTECTTATEGGPLENKKFCTVWVSAPATKTLSGAGVVDFYLYDATVARWAKDLVNSGAAVNVSGSRDLVVAQFYVGGPRGRICPVANGITASGDGTLVIKLVCTK